MTASWSALGWSVRRASRMFCSSWPSVSQRRTAWEGMSGTAGRLGLSSGGGVSVFTFWRGTVAPQKCVGQVGVLTGLSPHSRADSCRLACRQGDAACGISLISLSWVTYGIGSGSVRCGCSQATGVARGGLRGRGFPTNRRSGRTTSPRVRGVVRLYPKAEDEHPPRRWVIPRQQLFDGGVEACHRGPRHPPPSEGVRRRDEAEGVGDQQPQRQHRPRPLPSPQRPFRLLWRIHVDAPGQKQRSPPGVGPA